MQADAISKEQQPQPQRNSHSHSEQKKRSNTAICAGVGNRTPQTENRLKPEPAIKKAVINTALIKGTAGNYSAGVSKRLSNLPAIFRTSAGNITSKATAGIPTELRRNARAVSTNSARRAD